MEFLVTMTTRVPAGTPPAAVDDVRAREAAHTRELAARGHLLRLWRPPLAPGQWRTLGLFAAAGPAGLDRVLASMPLRVWRTDEVTPLAGHPNDPAPGAGAAAPPATGETPAEFLVTFTPLAPAVADVSAIVEAQVREAGRAAELAKQGHLVRLWTLPADHGVSPALGLWRAGDEAELAVILASLPLAPYLTTGVTPLTPHPSDPARPGSRPATTKERT